MDAANVAGMTLRGRAGSLLLRCYRRVAFHGVLIAFAIVFLGWNPPALFLRWVLPRRAAPGVGQAVISAGFRLLLGVMRAAGLAQFDLTALDALRDEPGLIIAPNHPSLIDVMLIISRLPRVVCITKASLLDSLTLGAGARLAGYIRNDASQHRLIRDAADAVRSGRQLLIFPEGTRSTADPIGPMRGGFALMARKAGAPVQTVLLESNTPYLRKGWGLLRQPPFPLFYRARLGRRFVVQGDQAAFVQQLDAYFRSELTRL